MRLSLPVVRLHDHSVPEWQSAEAVAQCIEMEMLQESEPAYRYEATIDYIDSLGVTESRVAKSQATELLRQRGPLKDYVAIVPVAAHQEPLANVERTLAQYACQEPRRSFTVLLGLNHPNNERDIERASRLLEQTRDLAGAHNNLDVRVLHTSYEEPRIGRIRRDLWNTVIMAGLEGGTLDATREMVGMNGDIDLVHMPRHVVASVQKYGDHELDRAHHQHVIPPFAVPLRHSTFPEYRRSSAFITWRDYLMHIAYLEFEAGMVMSLGRYAACGGISPGANRSEMLDTRQADGATMYERKLRTGISVTSGRRLIERLPRATWETAWEEGSFDAYNAYREGLEHCTDISWSRQTKLLLDTAHEAAACIRQGAERDAQEVAGAEAVDLSDYLDAPIRRRLRATFRVLTNIFDEYQAGEMCGRIPDELTKYRTDLRLGSGAKRTD